MQRHQQTRDVAELYPWVDIKMIQQPQPIPMDDPMEAKATAPVDLRPHPASLTAIASTDTQPVCMLSLIHI